MLLIDHFQTLVIHISTYVLRTYTVYIQDIIQYINFYLRLDEYWFPYCNRPKSQSFRREVMTLSASLRNWLPKMLLSTSFRQTVIIDMFS